jgi:hypothetical protein
VAAGTLAQAVVILLCLWLLSDLENMSSMVLGPLWREVGANTLTALLLAAPVMRQAQGERPYAD